MVTAANVHDKHPLPDLLHGNEQRVYADSAYASQKALIESKAPQARNFTNQRVRKGGEIDEAEREQRRAVAKRPASLAGTARTARRRAPDAGH